MCAHWQILFEGWPPPSGPWVSGQAPRMQEKQIASEPKLFIRKRVCVFMSFIITHKIMTTSHQRRSKLEKETDKLHAVPIPFGTF